MLICGRFLRSNKIKKECLTRSGHGKMMENNIMAKKCESGFTIIEVLVAMIIIGIMASIAIPGFSRWLPGYRLKTAARDLYSNMQLAKMEAIKTNTNCSINLSTGTDQYTVSCLNKTIVLSDYGSGVQFQGPAGETSTATITFTSRGFCNIGTVYLSNDNNSAYYRMLTSPYGGLKIQKWNGATWE